MPVITPGGGLGAHIDVKEFLPHVPQAEYSACALACALYICGGIRGMERGTLSEEREPDGTERIASMELLRLAFPRRVFTLSQTEYVIDRVKWLFDHRDLVGGLRFVHEPATLRFSPVCWSPPPIGRRSWLLPTGPTSATSSKSIFKSNTAADPALGPAAVFGFQ